MPTRDDETSPELLAELDDSWCEENTKEASIDVVVPDHVRRAPVLQQITGPGAPRDFRIISRQIVIGRSSSADIVIDAPELSRQHVKLEREGDAYKCTDLDSMHGLYLNGLKVYSCVLRPGDTIQLGNVTFVFKGGD